MASDLLNQLDCAKANAGSNPCRKVRVVAKVRGFTGPEADTQSGSSRMVDWISVSQPQGERSEGVTISFREQSFSRKESYSVDYCYGENEENEIIYSRDVKPLISAVFEGHNSTVIAYGARGSGKTHVIQGSADRPGLSVLAVTEFLSMAEQNGKSISVSFYEVDHRDHAVDLLNSEQPSILVFEDRGRIQFKGLSQTPLNSISEFQKLYFTACAARKAALKKGGCRSHMGLIVYVFSDAESAETGYVSKMNFVDLAGYEDVRKKSSDSSCLAEANKINRSVYSLLNVCHALNTNESRVPYRESKLTRMLQDSLRGTSRILMVVCMNPSFCQDTIYMVSLVSRSCQGIYRAPTDSTKKSESSARQIMFTSYKTQMLKSVSSTAKKLTGTRSHINEKKATGGIKSAIKGRKLFDEASHFTKVEKEMALGWMSISVSTTLMKELQIKREREDNSLSNTGNHVEPNPRLEKDNSISDTGNHVEPSPRMEKENSLSDTENHVEPNPRQDLDNSFPNAWNHMKPECMEENDDSFSDARNQVEIYPGVEKVVTVESEDHQQEHTPNSGNYMKTLSIVQEGHDMNKENNSSMTNKDGSPPISAQLRELSNSLKFLYSSTPSCVKVPEQECISLDNQVSTDIVEPTTPVIEQNVRVNDGWDVTNVKSPWETYSMRNSGMKNSIVQEYLKFLNTANKEELKRLKGIGEKRATFILELREESPEPFKSLDDLKDIGLSAKQIKGIMKKEVGELFN